jgi:hypothetical protein
MGDRAIQRLADVLPKFRLRDLDSSASIDDLETVEILAASPGLRHLERLAIWFDVEDTGDEAVRLLVASPHLTGLRSLELEHSRHFTDATLEAILQAPSLAGLKHCELTDNEESPFTEPVLRRFRERFPPADSEDDDD